ncbi:MAG: cytochrome c biogenesis protein CcsA [Cytophagales bacterium]|nr:cytochrome c biogenesis protein CcsA [Cytophagales bacterium]
MKDTQIFTFKSTLTGFLLALGIVGSLYFAFVTPVSNGVKYSLMILPLILGYLVYHTKVWKEFGSFLMIYTLIAGIMIDVPRLNIVNESIRNLFFHVPMWFGMIILSLASMIYAIKYLNGGVEKHDIASSELANATMLFGILGMGSGMIWAQYTWGKFWSGDPKQIYTAIGMLIYAGYFILRGAFNDDIQKARISAIFNIFAFTALIVCLYVLPRLTPNSLHPGGQEGNPAFGEYDLNNTMRVVFYPAIIGWTLMGAWISEIRIRTKLVYNKLYENI